MISTRLTAYTASIAIRSSQCRQFNRILSIVLTLQCGHMEMRRQEKAKKNLYCVPQWKERIRAYRVCCRQIGECFDVHRDLPSFREDDGIVLWYVCQLGTYLIRAGLSSFCLRASTSVNVVS